jgi:5-oxoprolinase (ATP-hydrolysing) subunit C
VSLTVVRALGLCTVQDLGRRGHMHEAVPPGGALVPELLVAANRAARNADAAPCIEVLGQMVVRASSDVLVAIDDVRHELRADEELGIASGRRRCTYLAIRGGVESPIMLDGHGTLLCAELGRPLRAGDVIRATSAPAAKPARTEPFIERDRITVIPGPDLDAFADDALALLTHAPYRILATSDRVGSRLAGAALALNPAYRARSRPMVIGALEVPGDGQPIVLGPEHPTTGGYPIIAVIANAELGRFHAIRLGGQVQFVLGV